MREIRSYGSVGVPAGNRRHYPAKSASRTGPRAIPQRPRSLSGVATVLLRRVYGVSTVYLPC